MQGEGYLKRGEPAIGIVVLGVSGCGKSTIGKMLAPLLDADFLEGDDYHSAENVAKMRAGHPLDDDDRWPWLDKLGVAAGEHLTKGRSVVVACSALRRAYREALSRGAGHALIFVHLSLDKATIAARMQARQHFMPVALLESQLETLEPLAPDEIGTEIVETGTAEETVQAIARWLNLRAAG